MKLFFLWTFHWLLKPFYVHIERKAKLDAYQKVALCLKRKDYDFLEHFVKEKIAGHKQFLDEQPYRYDFRKFGRNIIG